MPDLCVNPECGADFDPGHYGDRQVICGRPECLKWYKANWEFMSGIQRGMPDDAFRKVLRKTDRIDQKTLFLVARYSGMRKSELLGLEWNDVLDPSGKSIRGHSVLRRQWDDKQKKFRSLKTKRPRQIFFLPKAQKALDEYRRVVKPARDSRVFQITGTTAWRWWVQAQKRAKVTNPETGYEYRFHDLRHSLGLEIVRKGKIQLAKKLLGHADVNTTMKYAERTPEDILNELEGL